MKEKFPSDLFFLKTSWVTRHGAPLDKLAEFSVQKFPLEIEARKARVLGINSELTECAFGGCIRKRGLPQQQQRRTLTQPWFSEYRRSFCEMSSSGGTRARKFDLTETRD